MKIAINGFGRIGRAVYKVIKQSYSNLEIIAINDLADNAVLEHLLKYDSVYGKYNGNLDNVKLLSKQDPANLPWKDLDIDLVVESTGRFADYNSSKAHLDAGSKKVLISAPCKGADIDHFIFGVNHEKYKNQKIISAGSCTTTALAHMIFKINNAFNIKKGFATTMHSYTNNQNLVDAPHKDLRRTRSANLSIIPTTTGAVKTIGKIIPELDKKLDGIAVRVPTPIVSLIDLVCYVEKKTNADSINNLFGKNLCTKPLVSSDFKADPRPVIIDSEMTKIQDNLIKILGWYDNEYGYSVQLVKLLEYVINKK
ncbi:type I glyceraldehyde-3-phosphate dehydrogenase [bacterium]|nr:type I glyceraldehyde-3-phosphate dehydrogenase [bacterium]|tara:strand:- start:30429 stop:31361 length:933 start_codon:yes stop_codon:yes gene_type:complete